MAAIREFRISTQVFARDKTRQFAGRGRSLAAAGGRVANQFHLTEPEALVRSGAATERRHVLDLNIAKSPRALPIHSLRHYPPAFVARSMARFEQATNFLWRRRASG